MKNPTNIRGWLLFLLLSIMVTQGMTYYSFYLDWNIHETGSRWYSLVDIIQYFVLATIFLIGVSRAFLDLQKSHLLKAGLLYGLFSISFLVYQLIEWLYFRELMVIPWTGRSTTDNRLQIVYEIFSFWVIVGCFKVYAHFYLPIHWGELKKKLPLVQRFWPRRLLSFVVDFSIINVWATNLNLIAYLVLGEGYLHWSELAFRGFMLLIVIIAWSSYYWMFEYFGGATVGQALTGMRPWTNKEVSSRSRQILRRSIARIIPFEPLSIFSGLTWHERFSETRTLPENFDPETDYWAIDSELLDEGLI